MGDIEVQNTQRSLFENFLEGPRGHTVFDGLLSLDLEAILNNCGGVKGGGSPIPEGFFSFLKVHVRGVQLELVGYAGIAG